MRDFRFILFFFLGINVLAQSCSNSEDEIIIYPYEVLHDNSSKVWILDSQFDNNVNKTPVNRLEKWVLIFYNDQSFVLNTLENFGNFSVLHGMFTFSDDSKKIIYKWDSGQVDENTLIKLDRTNLIYEIHKNNNLSIKMHFIPLDKGPVPTNIGID